MGRLKRRPQLLWSNEGLGLDRQVNQLDSLPLLHILVTGIVARFIAVPVLKDTEAGDGLSCLQVCGA